jgi:hypothetical protein
MFYGVSRTIIGPYSKITLVTSPVRYFKVLDVRRGDSAQITLKISNYAAP